METATAGITPQVTPPISVPEPIVAAPVAPPVQPIYPSATPPIGSSNGGFGFFKEINWLEVSLMFLGALGLWYTIGYYKYKLQEDKVANADMHRRVDGLEQQIIALTTQQQDKQQGSTTGAFF